MKKLIIIALCTIIMGSLYADYQAPRPSLLDRESFIEYNKQKNGELSRATRKKMKNGYAENLKQQYQEAKEQAQQAYEYTKEKAKKAYEYAKEKAQEAYEYTKDYYQQGKEKVSQKYEELTDDE